MSLTKAKLIQFISSDTGFSQRKASKIFSVLLDIVTTTLANGDCIPIRGFGKFFVINQKERKIRHPSTGQIIIVGPKRAAKFKSFKFLHGEINDFGFVFNEFKRQNKIILQQLYSLIENSGDYEEEMEEDTI